MTEGARPSPEADALDERHTADAELAAASAVGTAGGGAISEDSWALSWATRPRLRGWFHAAAAVATVPVTVLAVRRSPKGAARAGVAVFGASYATMLTASAAYHRLPRSAAQARWFRRVDHAAIFGAIAGTWTPVALVILPAPAAAGVIAGVWGTAVAGAATKLSTLEGTRDHARWAYLALGWASVGLIPFVVRRAGWVPLANLVAGGIAYSAGAALLGSKRWPDATWFGHHEAWHVAVLGGGAFHAVAVGQLVTGSTVIAPPPRRRRFRRR